MAFVSLRSRLISFHLIWTELNWTALNWIGQGGQTRWDEMRSVSAIWTFLNKLTLLPDAFVTVRPGLVQRLADHFCCDSDDYTVKMSVYPRIFRGDFSYFNGTGSLYVCIRKSTEYRSAGPHCNANPRFIIPSIYRYKRKRKRFR